MPLFQAIEIQRDQIYPDLSCEEEELLRANHEDCRQILEKLRQEKFKDFNSWKITISKQWNRVLELQVNERSILFLVAQEQKMWFEKHVLKIAHLPSEDWFVKFAQATKKLKKLSSTALRTIIADPTLDSED
jgi:5'-deoxynucleotidase YfbR-like HD superfamily hydrolase